MKNNSSYLKNLGIKLLMLIPNFLIVTSACFLLYVILGLIIDLIDPSIGYYKSLRFGDNGDLIFLITCPISFIYLFVVTDKKYFFMLKSAILICLFLTIGLYFIGQAPYLTQKRINDDIRRMKQDKQLFEGLKKLDEEAKAEGYENWGEKWLDYYP